MTTALQAASGDRAAEHAGSPGTTTIAVASASTPHFAPPRLKSGDQTWTPVHVAIDHTPAAALVSAAINASALNARAVLLEQLSRAPAGCRPPPRR